MINGGSRIFLKGGVGAPTAKILLFYFWDPPMMMLGMVGSIYCNINIDSQ